MPAIKATRFHGYNALSFFAGKLSSHRDQPLPANIEPPTDNRLRRIAKSLWEPGLPAIKATRFHGYNALSFFAGKLSSHR
ncbi:hypothetical protein NLO98_28010, partial [Pseudomonas syringae]|nr:hypothetical protein [Pseudomonas syringae]